MNPRVLAAKNLLLSPVLPFWLLIVLLPFGRSAEAATALCTFGMLWIVARHRDTLRASRSIRLLLALLGCYIAAALLSCFFAVDKGKSWETTLALLRYVPLGCYACYVLRTTRSLHGLYFALAAVIACWALDAWMQILTGWSVRGHAEPERISGIFGAADLKLGPTLAVLSPFGLWAARRQWNTTGLIVAFLLLLGPVLMAGSRSAWIMYGVVVILFAWREAASSLRFATYCAALALTLLVAGGVAWKTSSRFDARMQRTFAIFDHSPGGLNQALTGRLDIWQTSLKMLRDRPITGVGVRDFRYAYPHYAPPNDHFITDEACGVGEGACHAHQLVLEVLTETGVSGLLLWLTGVGVALRGWWSRQPSAQHMAFPVTAALIAMTFPLNSHFAFYSAWWGLLFAWVLGLWCAALYIEPERAPLEINNGA